MSEPIFDQTKTFSGMERCLPLTKNLATQLIMNNPIRAFFAKSDLVNILQQPNCIGIRVYPTLTADNELTAMIVGVRSNRGEINRDGYLVADSGQERTVISERLFDDENFNTAGTRLMNHLLSSNITSPFHRSITSDLFVVFSAYFSERDLNEMLGDSDSTVTGIRFYLDTLGIGALAFDTFTAIAVDMDEEELLSVAIKSDAPCPPDCGGQDTYGIGEWRRSNS